MTTEQKTLVDAERALLSVLRDRHSMRATELIKSAKRQQSDVSDVNLRGAVWSLAARGEIDLQWGGHATLRKRLRPRRALAAPARR